MSELEGGAPRAPVRPSLAYLEGEVGTGIAEREGTAVRQDSADGDVIETSFSTDLVSLQQQLEEKERAAERAIRASLELRNELNAVRAEAATLKDAARTKSVEVGTLAPDDPVTSSRLVGDAFAELAKVRTEAFKSRMELERERNEHRAEMIQARAQYNAAQEELQRLIKVRRTNKAPAAPPVAAPAAAPPPHADTSPPTERWNQWRRPLIAVAAAFLVAVSGFLAWRRYPFSAPEIQLRETRHPPEVRPPPPKRAVVRPVATADDIRFAMTPAGRAQFQGAVGRLNHSLSGHFGKAPEEILREVHEKYKATDPNICAFDWRNGQPSLLYGGGSLSISQTLQKCADAVDRSR